MTTARMRLAAGALAVLAGLGVAAGFRLAVSTDSYNFWGAAIVIPIVIAVNVVLIRRVTRARTRILAPGAARHGLCPQDRRGARLATTSPTSSTPVPPTPSATTSTRPSTTSCGATGSITFELGGKQGTQWMELITTALYTVIGPSPLAAFVVFASFAFWGQYFLFRRSASPFPTATTRGMPPSSFCFPRFSTGRRASARRRG